MQQELAINVLLDVDTILQRPLSLQSEHSVVAPQDGVRSVTFSILSCRAFPLGKNL